MVKINKFQKAPPEKGEDRYLLEVSSGVEIVKCINTCHTALVYCKCQALITQEELDTIIQIKAGKKLAGYLVKVKTPPYQFRSYSGKMVTLDFAYAYQSSFNTPQLGITPAGIPHENPI